METFEELVGYAIQQVIKQGERSYKSGMCLYRGPNGLKCAVGMCISNEHYSNRIEHEGAHNMHVVNALRQSHPAIEFTENEIRVLVSLQQCHDTSSPSCYEDLKVDNFVDAFVTKIKSRVEAGALPDYCLKFLPTNEG